MPSNFQPLALFAGQCVRHVHSQITHVVEPRSEAHFAIQLRRVYVASADHINWHRELTEGELEIGVWPSARDGLAERYGVYGNTAFDHQAAEQLREVQVHMAHFTARVVRKEPVGAKCSLG